MELRLIGRAYMDSTPLQPDPEVDQFTGDVMSTICDYAVELKLALGRGDVNWNDFVTGKMVTFRTTYGGAVAAQFEGRTVHFTVIESHD